jgi:hypothetical protein
LPTPDSRGAQDRSSLADIEDDQIRALVTRLARPHRSGGDVVERAAIFADGADFAEVMAGRRPVVAVSTIVISTPAEPTLQPRRDDSCFRLAR